MATKIKNALKPKPKTNPNPSSSYPKQQFGTNTGGSSIGGGGFVNPGSRPASGGVNTGGSSYPKQQFGGSNTGGSSFSSGSSLPKPKKESKVKKRLKQAALIGAGAYVGYKLGKLKEKFSHRKWGGGHSSHSTHIVVGSSSVHRAPRYDFDDWNDWREADGFLCRSNDDCQWLDQNLNCEDYELDFSPARGWFGGDTVSIRGECTCEQGFAWNERELRCDRIYARFRPGSAQPLTQLPLVFITVLSLMLTKLF